MNVVQKYSGHSIDSIADIKALAQFIAANKAEDDGLVIVVGSMASTIERLESSGELFLFWFLWIMLTCVCIYGFYYLDNWWLEDRHRY